MRRIIVIAVVTGGLFAVSGCGNQPNTSAASLKPRLLPASAVPGFGLQRTLDWSDPVDLVGEGVALPASTHPSAAVKVFQNADLEGASGEVIQKGSGLDPTEFRLGVAKFDSAANASKARAWMHGEDMQEPCFAECVFSPRATSLPGVPSSSAVIQTPAVARPGSSANYRAEFTIGAYLYWVWGQAGASRRTQAQFKAAIHLYYRHAQRQQG